MSLVTAAEPFRSELIELSHFIHAHPELGYEEFESSAACRRVLAAHGFAIEENAAGLDTAFRAVAGSGSLVVAICVEFDALPEVGHACGHNIIAAASVGAGLVLAEKADELGITVVVLGTPSEEGGGGKIDLINAGYFDDVHFSLMVHPWPNDRLRAICLAVDHFDATFIGKNAHASAAPWEGRNALDALTISQVAMGLLRQQLRPGDQIHGITTDGGAAANIIPSKAVGRYMCRSVTYERLEVLRGRVEKCFEAGAVATDTELSIETLGHPFSHMVDDRDILAHYRVAAEATGRSFAADDAGEPIPTISTDMANVSLVVPAIHPLIGIETHGAVNHQPEFTASCITDSADRAVIEGAGIMAETVARVAGDSALRQRLESRT